MNKGALYIIQTLRDAGFEAYFAGGWVRDLLLGHPSDDIDIATSASTAQVMALFPRTIPVGIAFGIVIVVVHNEQYEVATFRKDLEYKDGRYPEGIEASNALEDAKRRDFTINGMFYDPIEQVIHDYVEGRKDLEARVIRTIGDPHERFNEDRLRILRAVRFASRLQFPIESETESAILKYAPSLLQSVSVERIWQELEKIALFPGLDRAILELHRLNLLGSIFPELENINRSKLEGLVLPFKHFPKNTPFFIYLIHLLADLNEKAIESLGKRYKLSNAQVKLAQFVWKTGKLVAETKQGNVPENIEWVRSYAHPDFPRALLIAAANHIDTYEEIIQFHETKRSSLQPHIGRLQNKTPLITSALLAQQGIQPGKAMGELLRHAERLEANYGLHTAEEVLQLLKKLGYWPKES